MRTTNEICVAVSECKPCTEQELRYCVAALVSMNHFVKRNLRSLVAAVDKPKIILELRAKSAKDMLDMIFKGGNEPVNEWLTPQGCPGTPEQIRELAMAKNVFKQATGMSLDTMEKGAGDE